MFLRLRLNPLVLLCGGLLLGGCVGNPSRTDGLAGHTDVPDGPSVEQALPANSDRDLDFMAAAEDLLAPEADDLWGRIRVGYGLQNDVNPRIDEELARLDGRQDQLRRILERSRPFLHFIVEELSQRDMPLELALLPAVESGFQPFAYSPGGAAGLWQFIPSTGQHYGLRQDWWMDARRDPYASTQAALRMLEELRDRYQGDWLLALAAYNCGPGRVDRALEQNARLGKPQDYWSLDLPRETDNYVPRLLAYARLIAAPEAYEFELPEIPEELRLALVDTGGQMDLRLASRLAGMDLDELLTLNAAYNRGATPPDGPHRLLVPATRQEALQEALEKLPEDERIAWQHHRVKSGETLGHIAKRYGVQVSDLQSANRLKGSLIRVGQDLMVPLSSAPIGPQLRVAAAPKLPQSRVRYEVRQGDSLYSIASKFQVKVADLQRWNDLDNAFIRPGQRLSLQVDPRKQL